MNRLMDFPMLRLSEKEKKWLKTKMKDDCPEVADTAREIYIVCFSYAECNAIKKQLDINMLSFGVHTEGVEQSVTLVSGQMAKLLRYIEHILEIFMWEEDYSLRPDEGDYDSFFDGKEDFFMEDLKEGLEVQPTKEPEDEVL